MSLEHHLRVDTCDRGDPIAITTKYTQLPTSTFYSGRYLSVSLALPLIDKVLGGGEAERSRDSARRLGEGDLFDLSNDLDLDLSCLRTGEREREAERERE